MTMSTYLQSRLTPAEILRNTYSSSKTALVLAYLDECFPIWANYGWSIGWCATSRDFSMWRVTKNHASSPGKSKRFEQAFDLREPGSRIDEAVVYGIRALTGVSLRYRNNGQSLAIDSGWENRPFYMNYKTFTEALDTYMQTLDGCWWSFYRHETGHVSMSGGLMPSSRYFDTCIRGNPELFGRNSHEHAIDYDEDDHFSSNGDCAATRCVKEFTAKLRADIARHTQLQGPIQDAGKLISQ